MTDGKELKSLGDESASTTEKDEIIELTDEIMISPEKDEEIIELKDVVTDVGSTKNETTDSFNTEVEEVLITDEMASEVSAEAAPSPEPPEAESDDEIKIGDEIEQGVDLYDDSQDEFVNSLGMDLETDSAINELQDEDDLPSDALQSKTEDLNLDSISSDQVEAAIERVLMKILPDRIESILKTAIEKTLSKEIDNLKRILVEESTENNE